MIDRERRAWLRFGIVVLAAALGETLGIVLQLTSSDLLVPLLCGAAAYYLTMGLNDPRYRSSGKVRYWRGKRIDDN